MLLVGGRVCDVAFELGSRGLGLAVDSYLHVCTVVKRSLETGGFFGVIYSRLGELGSTKASIRRSRHIILGPYPRADKPFLPHRPI